MTNDESKCVEVIIKTEKTTILKPIDLENVGFLQQQPTEIQCPACETETLSVVRLEAVTRTQRFVNWINCCKNWPGRHDINHYCQHCGCFIGRYVQINCMERCISNSARTKAAQDDMTLKTKPKDCAVLMQRARERVKAQRAQKQAEKAAKLTEQTQQQQQQTVVKIELVNQNTKQ